MLVHEWLPSALEARAIQGSRRDQRAQPFAHQVAPPLPEDKMQLLVICIDRHRTFHQLALRPLLHSNAPRQRLVPRWDLPVARYRVAATSCSIGASAFRRRMLSRD